MASPLEDGFYGYDPNNHAYGQLDDRGGIVGGARPKTRGTDPSRGYRGFHHRGPNVTFGGAERGRGRGYSGAERGRGRVYSEADRGRGRGYSGAERGRGRVYSEADRGRGRGYSGGDRGRGYSGGDRGRERGHSGNDRGRGIGHQPFTSRGRPISAVRHCDADRNRTRCNDEHGDKSSEQQRGGYGRRGAPFNGRPRQGEGQFSGTHRASDGSDSGRERGFRFTQPTNRYLGKTKESNASTFVPGNGVTNDTRRQGREGGHDSLTSPSKPQAKRKTTSPPVPQETLQNLLEEDPSDILKTFVSRKDEFIALLEQNQFTDDAFTLTLQVLSRICNLDSVIAVREDLNVALSIVDSSSFLSKHMSRYLVGLTTKQSQTTDCGSSTTDTLASEIELILKLVSVFLQHKPSSCGEVGVVLILLDKIVTTLALDDEDFDPQCVLMKQVQHLSGIFTHLEKAQQSAREKARERQPPDNFRDIPIFPDGPEIRKPTRPFLRKNIIKGRYDSVEHYLDVQFRLLREDFVAPLREGVAEYLSNTKNRLQDIRIYRNARIIDKGKLTNSGFVYRLQFDVNGLQRVRWESSKRLIYGSFICLTKDKFQTILGATIENRDINNLQKGIVEIRFLSEIGNTAPNGPFIMAETSAYFEACRHVLQGLQQMTPSTFPFKKFIVEVSSDVDPPAYLEGNEEITYDLRSLVPTSRRSSIDDLFGLTDQIAQISSHTARYLSARASRIGLKAARVPILRPIKWPAAETLHLDQSQKVALQAALTNEFAVIQGPPGTGKTYIGLKIIQILLGNKPWTRSSSPDSDESESSLSDEEEDNTESPILVVCYTNHALDQFLEGIVAFGEENVIRVGGRSSSEVLKSKNLSQIRRDRPHRRRQQSVPVGFLKRELHQAEENVKATLLKLDLAKTNILHFFELEGYCSRENNRDLIMPWLRGDNRFHPNTNLLWWLNVVDSTVDVPLQPPQRGQAQGRENRIYVEDEGYRIQQERRIDPRGSRNQPSQTEEDNLFEKIVAYGSRCNKRCGKNQCSTPQAELQKQDCMTDEEANQVRSIWSLMIWDRWRLYRLWAKRYTEIHEDKLDEYRQKYEKLSKQMQSVNDQDDVLILKEASVIGMTTTGAARLRSVLQLLHPRIVIVEEAAEVLEAHIITALTAKCQHLILIGDHQQLKPNPTVYRLAKVFNMDTSLFERMINNGVPCQTLNHQHRMRPEISKLMKKHFYNNLYDDESVKGFDDIKGVAHNMFFIDHNQFEDEGDDNKTKSNQYEAEVLVEMCRYLLHQGYEPTQITILTTYLGQLFTFKKLMDKGTFEGVRVSVVDNFQGEENDIILLSLVRSNEEGSIGFLKTSNRVCVALSRARMGFYCIGNGTILKKTQIWQDIIGTLETVNQVGPTLKLVCQNHPGKVAEVASAENFKAMVPQGGCGGPCEYRLPCGHVCELLCHPYDRNHKLYQCKKPCLEFCERAEHPCPKRCYVECGECTIMVTKKIPDCGHEIKVSCCKFDSASCTVPCTETLVCGHLCGEYCSQPCTSICRIKVKKTLPCCHSLSMECCKDPTAVVCQTHVMKVLPICGHELFMKCFLEPKHADCSKPCEKTLKCGHQCQKKCGEICQKLTLSGCKKDCTKPCEKTLKCGHKCQKKCGEICTEKLSSYSLESQLRSKLLSSYSTFCEDKCGATLPCGHPCRNKCGEPCSTPETDDLYSRLYEDKYRLPNTRIATKCPERVQRSLPNCGHSADMLCYEDVDEVRCPAACSKLLACGHPCTNRCFEPCSSCNKKVQKQLLCGHIAQVPCSQNVYNFKCNKKCNKELACGHQCPNQCCDPCPRPGSHHQFVQRGKTRSKIAARCEVSVQKTLPNCHHSVTTLCFRDTTAMRCVETCSKTLACGHRCTNKCGAPCKCKLKVWKQFLNCKHSMKLPCDRDITPNNKCKKCRR
ncbi:NFX1-type zinc finger-containing protein 1-like isoform X1 [Asterias rubens]|uniref:NFX1-type zinc finger-containing protein 1-like isoform X1 n=1 Tax=Asterias rubens TaxID=7604 RepID=UPI0014554E8A|nr:NFX1-type zinc finger-containing protein 1-like isoform X1 [Asterias rubens]XP_033625661.1 NFX1-type zinc finger-containing protein 1-like isoform X1 [Asterias rubens]XP_033625662.1 NFX1-type zinc finger-containing protein 1-like isoform X1 [Asterias rubens]